MNAIIDAQFEKLISTRGAHKKLGLRTNHVRTLRWMLRKGRNISTDYKLKALAKAGVHLPDLQYSRADMLAVLKFYENTSSTARELGAEYVLDKWMAKRG